MKLIGLMPVRNEDWILRAAITVALEWLDVLVIGLDRCTDNSDDIATELMTENPDKIVIIDQRAEETWNEMQHRDNLLQTARAWEATHVAIVDADELLSPTLFPYIRAAIEQLRVGQMLRLPGFNMRGDQIHTSGIWANRHFSVAFPVEPNVTWSGDLYHRREPNRAPHGWDWTEPFEATEGGVLHYWGASQRRLIAKHALYKITETLRWPDKEIGEIDRLYSLALKPELSRDWGPWEFLRLPPSFYHAAHKDIAIDDDPWQEGEVWRLLAEHGLARFRGLDLFGLDKVTL